jgi:hypothetical protein
MEKSRVISTEHPKEFLALALFHETCWNSISYLSPFILEVDKIIKRLLFKSLKDSWVESSRDIINLMALISKLETITEKPELFGGDITDIFKRERDAFMKMKEDLLRDERYRGKFVAVYGGNPVDSDENNRELAKRVYKKYGYIPIYIDKVEKKEEIIEIPSPELR